MFYNNQSKNKNYKTKKVIISSFSKCMNADANEYNLDTDVAKLSYNLKNKNDVLTLGNGFSELKLPNTQTNAVESRSLEYDQTNKLLKIWRYKYYSAANHRYDYMLIVFRSDNYIYYSSLFSYNDFIIKLGNFSFNEMPNALNFRVNGVDVICFCSPSDTMVVWYADSDPYQVSTAPKFKSICLHNGRLFAIDIAKNYLIRYSSNLNPLDWTSSDEETGAGVIELNDYKGQLKNLISFLDNVYVFRDFGISKIASYSSNSNYTVTNIYNSSCKIYCETACICGEDIYFFAEDGLYKFDGYKVLKVELNISSLFYSVKNDGSNTCFHDGKLFLACKLNFDDDNTIGCESEENFVNNALVEYDIAKKEFNLTRGIDISSMLSIKDLSISKMIVCMNGEKAYKYYQIDSSGKLLEEVLDKSWQSGKILFSNFDKQKILKEAYLLSKYDCTLEVETEKSSKSFEIKASSIVQRVRINKKGKEFCIKFNSNKENVFISSPQFVFLVEDS